MVPGRWPSSISACTTQFLNISGLIPSCSPTRRNVPDLVAGSRRASTAILVALSRSSSGYFLGAAMLLIRPWDQSLHQTRGDSEAREVRAGRKPNGFWRRGGAMARVGTLIARKAAHKELDSAHSRLKELEPKISQRVAEEPRSDGRRRREDEILSGEGGGELPDR